MAVASALAPFYCHTCGRMEGPGVQACPECGARRQFVSRFEWFLADAIEDRLKAIGLSYEIHEQWPLRDRRSFTWYFDLAVTVYGRLAATEIIEINGASHLAPHSRDDEKWRAYRAFASPDMAFRIVANDECRMAVVGTTADRIVAALIRRAS